MCRDHLQAFARACGSLGLLFLGRRLPVSSLHRLHERHRDDMLGHEPDLQLVAADHIADEQVVRPIITAFSGTPAIAAPPSARSRAHAADAISAPELLRVPWAA